jgi:hypothetical protein
LFPHFVEVASIMAQSSCYCQCIDRNSVCWLMYDIHHHSLLRAEEVTWDVMVASHTIHVAVAGHLTVFVTVVII